MVRNTRAVRGIDNAYFKDTNKTDERRHGLRGEIAGEKSPKECEAFATPGIEGTLPLGLRLDALEGIPERVELEGEEEVENGAGQRYEESDGSCGTEVPKNLEQAPAREGKDGPG